MKGTFFLLLPQHVKDLFMIAMYLQCTDAFCFMWLLANIFVDLQMLCRVQIGVTSGTRREIIEETVARWERAPI